MLYIRVKILPRLVLPLYSTCKIPSSQLYLKSIWANTVLWLVLVRIQLFVHHLDTACQKNSWLNYNGKLSSFKKRKKKMQRPMRCMQYPLKSVAMKIMLSVCLKLHLSLIVWKSRWWPIWNIWHLEKWRGIITFSMPFLPLMLCLNQTVLNHLLYITGPYSSQLHRSIYIVVSLVFTLQRRGLEM